MLRLQTQLARFLTSAWYTLRRPQTTGWLLAIWLGVLGLGLIIPQQAGLLPSDTAREAWIAGLPLPVQSWGELLYSLGMARMFDSLWFWLPLGLLLLNSLIALADYGPGSWRRLQPEMPSLGWQHPLARRDEQSSRLPEAPDTFLDQLRAALTAQGFYLYPSLETETKLLGAALRRWAWLGPLVFYVALLILIAAVSLSHTFLQLDTLTLRPLEPQTSSLFPGEFELRQAFPAQHVSQVGYSSRAKDESLLLDWRLYLPTFFDNALIWPWAMDPVITVEARNEAGAMLRLIPSQDNLFPAERLHLSLAADNTPVYFLIPATGLAFQIAPHATDPQRFEVQVRRGSESAPAEKVEARAGQPFEVNGVALKLTRNSNVTVIVLRDPALLLYGLAGGLMGIAAIFTFWLSPVQVWFIPEVKGRGGQLYSVVERFGREAGLPLFLELILWPEKKSNDNNKLKGSTP